MHLAAKNSLEEAGNGKVLRIDNQGIKDFNASNF
jgi:hypothetical protein